MSEYYRELLESADTDIGVLPGSVYQAALPWPVAWLRHCLISRLPAESRLLARHQAAMRRRLGHWGDVFFVYTSLLGTHSFFLIFLPLTFWLGSQRNGRGLVAVTAIGCWMASVVKDLLCLPRPYAPPMRRLAIGTHHLEYGFPSTHTTNCVSMALYGFLLLRDRTNAALAPDSYLPPVPSWVPVVIGLALAVYAVSVAYGRVYAGMHSLMDVTGGALLGAGVIPVQRALQHWLEPYLVNPSLWVPSSITAVFLLLVTIHPQPVEDCPCFEDAVAFMAVLAGVNLGRWFDFRVGWLPVDDDPLHMRAKMDLFVPRVASRLTRGHGAVSAAVEMPFDFWQNHINPILGVPPLGANEAWRPRASVIVPVLVVVLGIAQMIIVRLVAKSISRALLPPLFNAAQKASRGLAMLPRRHYTPAQEYGGVVPQRALSPTPSILDDYEWRVPTPVPQSPGPGPLPHPGIRARSPLSARALASSPLQLSATALEVADTTALAGKQDAASIPGEDGPDILHRRRPERSMTGSSAASASASAVDTPVEDDHPPKPVIILHYDVDGKSSIPHPPLA